MKYLFFNTVSDYTVEVNVKCVQENLFISRVLGMESCQRIANHSSVDVSNSCDLLCTPDHSSFQYFSQENAYLCKYDHSWSTAIYLSLTTNAVTVLFAYSFQWLSSLFSTQPHEMTSLMNNGFYIWKIKSTHDTGLIPILV